MKSVVRSIEEVGEAFSNLKWHKAPGCDWVKIELIQSSPEAIEKTCRLCIDAYANNSLPKDWLCRVIICLHKNGQTDKPFDYRTICLMSHVYKVLSVVLLKRTMKCIDKQISDSQSGFHGAKGTGNNLFVVSAVVDWITRDGSTAILTFVDYSAAFDSVSHSFLKFALLDRSVPIWLVNFIMHIYSSAMAKWRTLVDTHQMKSPPDTVCCCLLHYSSQLYTMSGGKCTVLWWPWAVHHPRLDQSPKNC